MSEEMPAVARQLSLDQTVGHEELRKARVAHPIPAPDEQGWARMTWGAHRRIDAIGLVEVSPTREGWRWRVYQTQARGDVATLEEAKREATREAIRCHLTNVASLTGADQARWTREEREEGVCGYYLKRGPLSCAIWGVVPHASAEQQRWGWAIHLDGMGGAQVTLAAERPVTGDLDALARSPEEAWARLDAGLTAWQAAVCRPLTSMEVAG